MDIDNKDLPEVNQYIKENNLKPCFVDEHEGHLYDSLSDITYLVIYDDGTYISYGSDYYAELHARIYKYKLVICRGKIND